jgi:predicted ATPase/DNA-binding XRE family transcriptional regulator
METTASFGYWLRRQRRALDLTQQALAERVGCSLAAIKKIEGDERRPSRQIAERLADILGVPASQRQIFLECARGLRPVDQLLLAREPAVATRAPRQTRESFPHNLPAQLTSFVGRGRELAEARQLLGNTRLLTLTGPGGTGKTRLALQLAADVLDTFADGIWLVELAPLADPSLATQTVASTLGVREQPGRPIRDALMDFVRAKSMVLILDNCEHLIETCAQLADSLLRAAPRLKILASSREALGIAGETSYRVPSLPLPDSRQLHDLDAVAQNDCVHLFVDRASAAYSPFRLKEKNAPAIADICRRLDGIPLAIELAAARTKVFPAKQIAARLDDRFRLLTGGSRTALERHQTLRALIDWSYDLLSDEERMLFRQLSVFAGGWSFEAAQAVCGDGLGGEVLDLLTHLVDKSLVAFEEELEEGRYRLPETIRQYARDKLFESGQAEQVRDRHLDFFLGFAEEAEPKLRSEVQLEWLERVENDYDNLRTALAWSLESGKSDPLLQLAGALSYFWVLRGYFSEGQKWLNNALALSELEQSKKFEAGIYTPTHVEMAHHAKGLYGASYFQLVTLNLKSARKTVEESLRLWRELGDKWWMAVTLECAGLIMAMDGDIQTALNGLEEGVALARELQDPWPLAACLVRFGDELQRTDVTAARRFLEEGVAVARRVGDKSVLSEGLRELGSVYYLEGNLTAAVSIAEEALAEARAIGSIGQVVLALFQLVVISCSQNNPAKAKGYCFELGAIGRETGALMAAGLALISFGLAESIVGEPGRGVRLLAATDVLLRQRSVKLISGEDNPLVLVYKQALEKAQAQLGPAAFEAAWAEGQQMTPEQALALATENGNDDSPLPKDRLGPSSDA